MTGCPVWLNKSISGPTEHSLEPRPLSSVANWPYADATLERYWDEILSTNKLRAHGFDGWADSEAAFFTALERYREARILP